MITGARFSECRTWRYALWRIWEPEKLLAAFIGLNPSTANEVENDPTVTRCRNYAMRWGYGGLLMLNIFALRSTDPGELYKAADPVGPDTDYWLRHHLEWPEVGLALAAWGSHGMFRGRGREVENLLRPVMELHCLGLTKQLEPRHPLYLRGDLMPITLPAGRRGG